MMRRTHLKKAPPLNRQPDKASIVQMPNDQMPNDQMPNDQMSNDAGTGQNELNFARIETAIAFIVDNFQDQPSLTEIAAVVDISPFHFQRLFCKWAGVSPKKFLQYLSLEHAKAALGTGRATLLDAAFDSGLSGGGRLHDLFVAIEGMTPSQFKGHGAGQVISYDFAATPFGEVIIAATPTGICHLAFGTNRDADFASLRQKFPKASFQHTTTRIKRCALSIFHNKDRAKTLEQIKLHLKGSAFQLKIWQALLKIPQGSLATYGDIAELIGQPNASRAVGTAIASNPVAFLIPCHRVIRKTGQIGGYKWGLNRKGAMIGWEAARC